MATGQSFTLSRRGFALLDGTLDDKVIAQIKNYPKDLQVREAVDAISRMLLDSYGIYESYTMLDGKPAE